MLIDHTDEQITILVKRLKMQQTVHTLTFRVLLS